MQSQEVVSEFDSDTEEQDKEKRPYYFQLDVPEEADFDLYVYCVLFSLSWIIV